MRHLHPGKTVLPHARACSTRIVYCRCGADSEEKQELEPELLASSKVVVDLMSQSASIGDFHHALDAGIVTQADIHAELGDVIAGMKPGRSNEEEVIIFDSTGTALQDVVAAVIVYERAVKTSRGDLFNFVA